MTLHLVAGDLTQPGGQDIFIGNSITNSSNVTCLLGTESSLNVTSAVAPSIQISPTSIAFGNETVGIPATKPVIVTNNGTSPVSITGITVTGANTVSFQQTNSCGSSIAGLGSCTINVTFNPTGTGARSASVTLNDSLGTQNVPLTGTGVAPPISISPTSIAFGNETVGVPVVKPVTVKNNGPAAISVTSVTVTGANTVSFQQSNNCGNSIAASSTCTINVTFRPTGIGARSASITLMDSVGTQNVPLTGTGVAAPITLTPTSIAFGNETVNVPVSKPVTVKNNQTTAISVTNITVTGANTVSFQQTNSCGSGIPASGTCTITVTFKPTGTGARSASVTLTDSTGTQNVTLTGTGVAAPITLSPTSIAFGNETVNVPISKPITVTNSGTSAITFSSITVTGANTVSFQQTNTCGSAIPSPGSCTITVTFKPTGTGARSASVTLVENIGAQNVPLTGPGVAPY